MRFLSDDPAPTIPYLPNRAAYDAAAALITEHGDDAGFQAAARAEFSRNQGNVQHFCHWRQIERLIVLLSTDTSFGTLQ